LVVGVVGFIKNLMVTGVADREEYSMSWIKPENVISPQIYWKLEAVLYDAGEGNPAIALGTWEEESVIAIRWNGTNEEGKSLGNPQSSGHPTWFVLPKAIAIATLRTLAEKLASENKNVRSEYLTKAIAKLEVDAGWLG